MRPKIDEKRDEICGGTQQYNAVGNLLKYGSEEKGPSLCKCSILQGFFMSKKLERLRSELLSEDKITNLLGFLTQEDKASTESRVLLLRSVLK